MKKLMIHSMLLIALIFTPHVNAKNLQIDRPKIKASIHIDSEGVPHIRANSERDAQFALGYIEAKMRFWKMDVSRKAMQGRLAELLGPDVLGQDGFIRTIRLRENYVEPSFNLVDDHTRELVQAYADGVNAYIMDPKNPLPSEYKELELSRASIEPWTAKDSLYVAGGIILSLTLDTSDIDNTLSLLNYTGILGEAGVALYYEDMVRSQGFDPDRQMTTPDYFAQQMVMNWDSPINTVLTPQDFGMSGKLVQSIARIKQHFQKSPVLASNWIIIGGDKSSTGYPIMANDPHLGLSSPSIWFEYTMTVPGEFSIGGYGICGIGGFISFGRNNFVAFGGTNSTADTSDIYLEQLGAPDPVTGLPMVVFNGQNVTVEKTSEAMKANLLNGQIDDIVTITSVTKYNVPHHGPVIDFFNGQPITIKLAAFSPDNSIAAGFILRRATNVFEARDALLQVKAASQNWSLIDVHGNFGYVTSAVVPIREDLQAGLVIPGYTPNFVRDGTRTLPHEWVANDGSDPNNTRDFMILPDDELPQEFNPARGYIVNGNNDQVGVVADNDPFNQLRKNGGVYYFSDFFADGRISQLYKEVEDLLATKDKISPEDVANIQNSRKDSLARVLVPNIVQAYDNAKTPGANPALADLLTNNPKISEAVNDYLRGWDFDTPTGIQTGYDIGDDPNNLPVPSAAEIKSSVAAVIFFTWGHQAIERIITDTLNSYGLAGAPGRSTYGSRTLSHFLNNFQVNQGVGASGIDFFQQNVPVGLSAEERRDYIVLLALHEALERLQSTEFDSVFAQSPDLSDYRLGKMQRTSVPHDFNMVSALSNERNTENLARGGSNNSINLGVGWLNIHGPTLTTSFGPSLRVLVEVRANGIKSNSIYPGGQEGEYNNPLYDNRLLRWLVGDRKQDRTLVP